MFVDAHLLIVFDLCRWLFVVRCCSLFVVAVCWLLCFVCFDWLGVDCLLFAFTVCLLLCGDVVSCSLVCVIVCCWLFLVVLG